MHAADKILPDAHESSLAKVAICSEPPYRHVMCLESKLVRCHCCNTRKLR